MARELSPAELDELLGAYALDAIDGDERDQVDGYLARTPAARAEVARLRETAALLAHAGGEAPSGLWDRIEGALAEEPPPAPVVPLAAARHRPARSRWLRVGAAVAAAAAAAVIVLLGVEVTRQDDRIDTLTAGIRAEELRRAAEVARVDPRSRTVVLTSDDGRMRADVVLMPDGHGFFMGHDLPRLSEDRTYQLWAVLAGGDGPEVVSAGVLGRAPDVVSVRAGRPVTGFAVTKEEAPGVRSSEEPPVMEGLLS